MSPVAIFEVVLSILRKGHVTMLNLRVKNPWTERLLLRDVANRSVQEC